MNIYRPKLFFSNEEIDFLASMIASRIHIDRLPRYEPQFSRSIGERIGDKTCFVQFDGKIPGVCEDVHAGAYCLPACLEGYFITNPQPLVCNGQTGKFSGKIPQCLPDTFQVKYLWAFKRWAHQTFSFQGLGTIAWLVIFSPIWSSFIKLTSNAIIKYWKLVIIIVILLGICFVVYRDTVSALWKHFDNVLEELIYKSHYEL